MPSEESMHEGTWLQWPYNFTYGSGAEDAEASWVQMTAALSPGERVHIMPTTKKKPLTSRNP